MPWAKSRHCDRFATSSAWPAVVSEYTRRRRAPPGAQVLASRAVALEPVQRRIDRPLRQVERATGALPQRGDDGVAVARADPVQGRQQQQVEVTTQLHT